jgi:hypothetical protein
MGKTAKEGEGPNARSRLMEIRSEVGCRPSSYQDMAGFLPARRGRGPRTRARVVEKVVENLLDGSDTRLWVSLPAG